MRKSVSYLLAFMMSLLFASHAIAQTAGTGVIFGTITDPTGASISGATVTLTDLATNAVRTATTNDAGRYDFPNVPPGKYSITIAKSGFRQAKVANLNVVVGESRTVDAKMELGAATESVEVVASNTDLQTMNATVGNTISGVALDSLPSIGRDVSTFVTLQPGVSPDGSVAGAIYDQNTYQLDGGNNSNDMDGTMNVYTPSGAGDPSGGTVNSYVSGGGAGTGGPTGVMPTPVDSIEEFKVATTNQTADFNSSAGAQVSMVTKRGTSQWHGTAYEYYFNNNWNANTWDNNANGVPIALYHYNRFGASGGGPIIPKDLLGGKWFFFGNYEGFRWPNSETLYRLVPSAMMKQGILQFKDSTGAVVQYNLNPANGPISTACTVTVANPTGSCDPRGLGISPTMQALWALMPASNTSCGPLGSKCDGLNTQGFVSNLSLPWTENFGVGRIDHDFAPKWHFSATYHINKLQRATHNEVDIGGVVGGKLGEATSVHNRPQQPSYYTAALTTNVTNNLTNDVHFSYLRNYWARYFTGSSGLPQTPQVAGLGGALQPLGESRTTVLAPYNLDTQNVRTRFWDGQDTMIRDDVSWVKGKHFFQFGGTYQHNFNWHQRTDNGGSVNNEIVYDLAAGGNPTNSGNPGTGVDMTGFIPAGVSAKNWQRDYAEVLGMLSLSQVAYTRTAPNLGIQPVGAPIADQSTIPYYNLYASDSWRMKPTLTVTYGLGWTLEMPPHEKDGKQIVLVGPDNKPISTEDYLSKRASAALTGQVYNPNVGFDLVHNVAGNPKYPYDPYYKGFSPRVAAAWNPNYDSGFLSNLFGRNKTVIRGGYSILYGRLNGVAQLLTPLLSTGLIQAVQCFSPLTNGTCGGTSTPNNAFRIGPGAGAPGQWDGLVAPIVQGLNQLPQPDFPGVNAANAATSEALDPKLRPSMSHQFDLTIQRQINNKTTVEFGYIGRKYTHDIEELNLNAVPYMMTVGGQRFDKAFGKMVLQYCTGASDLSNIAHMAGGNCDGNLAAVTEQPFFKAALNPSYCAITGGNCTQAVAKNEGGNIANNAVWSLWSDLDNGAFTFPRSMMNTPIAGNPFGANGQMTSGIGMTASDGFGNYNAAFASVRMSDWHGLTMQSNFTYGKALGTGSIIQATSSWTVPDVYNLHNAYGLQPWDRKFLWNVFFVYQPPAYKGQHGALGRALGGWSIAPILTVGSGLPVPVIPTDGNLQNQYQIGGGQAFGESDGLSGTFSAFENAVNMCGSGVGGSSRHNNPTIPAGSDFGQAFFNPPAPNMFQNPAAVYSCFRNPILGIDSSDGGGAGILRGQKFWNVDLGVRKDIMVTERLHLQFDANFTNLFNHPYLGDPYNVLGDTLDWGALGGITGDLNTGFVQANVSRAMQLGLRIRF